VGEISGEEWDQIVAWHEAKVSNGPTEGMNNLLKRVKRVAFGFTHFDNFRIRALLYAGKPASESLTRSWSSDVPGNHLTPHIPEDPICWWRGPDLRVSSNRPRHDRCRSPAVTVTRSLCPRH
jgi:hypothetical protein